MTKNPKTSYANEPYDPDSSRETSREGSFQKTGTLEYIQFLFIRGTPKRTPCFWKPQVYVSTELMPFHGSLLGRFPNLEIPSLHLIILLFVHSSFPSPLTTLTLNLVSLLCAQATIRDKEMGQQSSAGSSSKRRRKESIATYRLRFRVWELCVWSFHILGSFRRPSA